MGFNKQRNESCYFTVGLFITICYFSLCVVGVGTNGGRLYTIASDATGKLVTIKGDIAVDGAKVVLASWVKSNSQMWIPMRTTPMTSRYAGINDQYLLIPMRQFLAWGTLRDKVGRSLDGVQINDLPNTTLVLGLDEQADLTLEVLTHKASQMWLIIPSDSNRYFIKNYANQQCIKNFDHKPQNFLLNLRSRIAKIFGTFQHRDPAPLGTLECNDTDISEKWKIDVAT